MLLLQQMIVLFIYMMVGYGACKKGKLDDYTSSKFSWIVLNVSNPMLILSAAVNSNGSIEGKELLVTAGVAVGMFATFMLLAMILPKLLRVKKEDIPLYKLMTVFNNMAFMGFPVISAAYGNDSLLYASVFLLPFNVLIYTYGIQVVSKESSGKIQWKKVLNVGVIACVIATVIYLMKIPTPDFVKSTSQGLGHLSGPLSMMVTGISLTKINLRKLFTDVKLLVFAMIKLMIIPVVGGVLLRMFIDNEILCGVVTIIMSTPVASMTVMLAQEHCDNYEAIVKGISLTTILSVVTIPLVSAIVAAIM